MDTLDRILYGPALFCVCELTLDWRGAGMRDGCIIGVGHMGDN